MSPYARTSSPGTSPAFQNSRMARVDRAVAPRQKASRRRRPIPSTKASNDSPREPHAPREGRVPRFLVSKFRLADSEPPRANSPLATATASSAAPPTSTIVLSSFWNTAKNRSAHAPKASARSVARGTARGKRNAKFVAVASEMSATAFRSQLTAAPAAPGSDSPNEAGASRGEYASRYAYGSPSPSPSPYGSRSPSPSRSSSHSASPLVPARSTGSPLSSRPKSGLEPRDALARRSGQVSSQASSHRALELGASAAAGSSAHDSKPPRFSALSLFRAGRPSSGRPDARATREPRQTRRGSLVVASRLRNRAPPRRWGRAPAAAASGPRIAVCEPINSRRAVLSKSGKKAPHGRIGESQREETPLVSSQRTAPPRTSTCARAPP